MHRFYLPPDQCRAASLQLTDGEAHHAVRVLRVQPRERVVVLDGSGNEFLCAVATADRRAVLLEIVEKKTVLPPPCRITLLQAIPKGKIIESIIQKATELGAHRLVPILAERVTTKLDAKITAAKQEQWQQVAIEAIKQCGAVWLPQVDTPMTPAEFLMRKETHDLALVGALLGERKHPREIIQRFQSEHGRAPESVAVWIGPEGDFTPAESKLILNAGAKPISLGPLVLRVETAAIYCLSFLNYELTSNKPAD